MAESKETTPDREQDRISSLISLAADLARNPALFTLSKD